MACNPTEELSCATTGGDNYDETDSLEIGDAIVDGDDDLTDEGDEGFLLSPSSDPLLFTTERQPVDAGRFGADALSLAAALFDITLQFGDEEGVEAYVVEARNEGDDLWTVTVDFEGLRFTTRVEFDSAGRGTIRWQETRRGQDMRTALRTDGDASDYEGAQLDESLSVLALPEGDAYGIEIVLFEGSPAVHIATLGEAEDVALGETRQLIVTNQNFAEIPTASRTHAERFWLAADLPDPTEIAVVQRAEVAPSVETGSSVSTSSATTVSSTQSTRRALTDRLPFRLPMSLARAAEYVRLAQHYYNDPELRELLPYGLVRRLEAPGVFVMRDGEIIDGNIHMFHSRINGRENATLIHLCFWLEYARWADDMDLMSNESYRFWNILLDPEGFDRGSRLYLPEHFETTFRVMQALPESLAGDFEAMVVYARVFADYQARGTDLTVMSEFAERHPRFIGVGNTTFEPNQLERIFFGASVRAGGPDNVTLAHLEAATAERTPVALEASAQQIDPVARLFGERVSTRFFRDLVAADIPSVAALVYEDPTRVDGYLTDLRQHPSSAARALNNAAMLGDIRFYPVTRAIDSNSFGTFMRRVAGVVVAVGGNIEALDYDRPRESLSSHSPTSSGRTETYTGVTGMGVVQARAAQIRDDEDDRLRSAQTGELEWALGLFGLRQGGAYSQADIDRAAEFFQSRPGISLDRLREFNGVATRFGLPLDLSADLLDAFTLAGLEGEEAAAALQRAINFSTHPELLEPLASHLAGRPLPALEAEAREAAIDTILFGADELDLEALAEFATTLVTYVSERDSERMTLEIGLPAEVTQPIARGLATVGITDPDLMLDITRFAVTLSHDAELLDRFAESLVGVRYDQETQVQVLTAVRTGSSPTVEPHHTNLARFGQVLQSLEGVRPRYDFRSIPGEYRTELRAALDARDLTEIERQQILRYFARIRIYHPDYWYGYASADVEPATLIAAANGDYSFPSMERAYMDTKVYERIRRTVDVSLSRMDTRDVNVGNRIADLVLRGQSDREFLRDLALTLGAQDWSPGQVYGIIQRFESLAPHALTDDLPQEVDERAVIYFCNVLERQAMGLNPTFEATGLEGAYHVELASQQEAILNALGETNADLAARLSEAWASNPPPATLGDWARETYATDPSAVTDLTIPLEHAGIDLMVRPEMALAGYVLNEAKGRVNIPGATVVEVTPRLTEMLVTQFQARGVIARPVLPALPAPGLEPVPELTRPRSNTRSTPRVSTGARPVGR